MLIHRLDFVGTCIVIYYMDMLRALSDAKRDDVNVTGVQLSHVVKVAKGLPPTSSSTSSRLLKHSIAQYGPYNPSEHFPGGCCIGLSVEVLAGRVGWING